MRANQGSRLCLKNIRENYGNSANAKDNHENSRENFYWYYRTLLQHEKRATFFLTY